MVFNSKGVDYKITGANMRGRKYPIKAARMSDGAAYKFPISTVRKGNPLCIVAAPAANRESMMEFLSGVAATFILIFILAWSFSIGDRVAKTNIARECDSIGIIYINEKSYKCEEMK